MHYSNKTLIVGTGFGSLYKDIYESLGWQVTTVDLLDPNADYNDLKEALNSDQIFDTAHITTPNHTHYEIANTCAKKCKIVFVEKPGVSTSAKWESLLEENTSTRIMMVKNNQYRDNINEIKQACSSGTVNINWINNNRIPKPGSWFTNKKLAFGGVSRDLMPHLLSWYQVLVDDWNTSISESETWQHWNLEELSNSDYGKVDPQGVYDVDDECEIMLGRFILNANWRSMSGDDIAIHAENKTFELGLCPESAYEKMILTAYENLNNDEYWQQQEDMDLWIHQILQNL